MEHVGNSFLVVSFADSRRRGKYCFMVCCFKDLLTLFCEVGTCIDTDAAVLDIKASVDRSRVCTGYVNWIGVIGESGKIRCVA